MSLLNVQALNKALPTVILGLFLSSYTTNIDRGQVPNIDSKLSNNQLTTPILINSTEIIADNTSDQAAIKLLIDRQFKALNERNPESYMATVDPNSPGFQPTIITIAEVFKRNLKYEPTKIEIVGISGNEAKVRIEQTTTKIDGSSSTFRDNKMIILHTLRKSNGEWKFFSSVPENIQYLN
ncbi:MAG: hypothetical protein JGK12_00810 [Microcoleus sp. PH2017_01_SCD_O_A]|uniref:hypothetical protein n=1 Tax=unclassified Microcoleus TaxID=2642155 RepID=UPI001D9F418A|nr:MULTISPECIES: hypothetical protein [unclassified Microcoleus]MCC3422486.1 hypothetical protein [Microcoleus sp. PH2017_01_SCD_O_A]MCC3431098.1 hypothetical protein [Microcoleus sp. PH2017_04_SCI_O_A]MCC3501849.1 hypothetical protein [Microcoleus sp. PH2017_19_SFW_U_A]MCC3533909.1 hypothetical protein [Microcoleus sp. PH2017_25_DOB_D_A]MCC3641377.1 hypothetical protein [Microcoleus sp. PH2017_33_LGB_O_A]TAE09264.1 MAG: hypothetical protein EAZ94_22550 [Oscillatoriales cyanobacterium]